MRERLFGNAEPCVQQRGWGSAEQMEALVRIFGVIEKTPELDNLICQGVK